METAASTEIDFRSDAAVAGRIKGAKPSIPPVAREAKAEPSPILFDATFCDGGRQAEKVRPWDQPVSDSWEVSGLADTNLQVPGDQSHPPRHPGLRAADHAGQGHPGEVPPHSACPWYPLLKLEH